MVEEPIGLAILTRLRYNISIMGLVYLYEIILVCELTMKENHIFNSRVIRDLDEFKNMSDVIFANRYNDDIADVLDKVYTRDLYFRD